MLVHKFVEQNVLWSTHFGQTINLLGNFNEIFYGSFERILSKLLAVNLLG